jgi:hypothetical protein
MGKPLDEAPLTRLSIMDLFSGSMPESLALPMPSVSVLRWRPNRNLM